MVLLHANQRTYPVIEGPRLLAPVFTIPANSLQPWMKFYTPVPLRPMSASGYTIIWNGPTLEPSSFVTEMTGRKEIGSVVVTPR
jgi:hypothetical protein